MGTVSPMLQVKRLRFRRVGNFPKMTERRVRRVEIMYIVRLF